ncbi:MAG: hypothetical protein WBJ81_00400 [Rickettsiales bacterium]
MKNIQQNNIELYQVPGYFQQVPNYEYLNNNLDKITGSQLIINYSAQNIFAQQSPLNVTSLSQELNYFQQVQRGYEYLYRDMGEISWHQLIIDPIQDSFLKIGLTKLIQYHTPSAPIPIQISCSHGGCTSPHNIINDNHDESFTEHFIEEYAIHASVKVAATIMFPIIYPLNISNYLAPNIRYAGDEIIKFLGIAPLEVISSIKILPNSAKIIGNSVDYLTFRENHYTDRAQDPEYEEFANEYETWMEAIDAAMHAYDEFSTIINNLHTKGMFVAANIWYQARTALYSTSQAAKQIHDQKIHDLREELIPKTENLSEETTWGQWLYSPAKYIATQVASALITSSSILAYTYFGTKFNKFFTKNSHDSISNYKSTPAEIAAKMLVTSVKKITSVENIAKTLVSSVIENTLENISNLKDDELILQIPTVNNLKKIVGIHSITDSPATFLELWDKTSLKSSPICRTCSTPSFKSSKSISKSTPKFSPIIPEKFPEFSPETLGREGCFEGVDYADGSLIGANSPLQLE